MSEYQASDFQDEEMEMERALPPGGVVSVRFNPQEMEVVLREQRRTGEKLSTLIKQEALAHIRQSEALRSEVQRVETEAGALRSCLFSLRLGRLPRDLTGPGVGWVDVATSPALERTASQ